MVIAADTDAAWGAARNVLCVRLDSIGDVLMTTPAIRALRERTDGRRITLLTSPAGGAIAAFVPEIDEVITYEAPWLKASASSEGDGIARMAQRLGERAYDACVIFTVFSQSALPAAMLAFMAGIPLRIAHARERAYQLLTREVKEREPEQGIRHEVDRQLALVNAVGAAPRDSHLSLRVSPDARVRLRLVLRAQGLPDGEAYAVVHPGATAESRRYPAAGFAAAAAQIAERTGLGILVTGGAGNAEWELANEVCTGVGDGARNLSGLLALDELVALIDGASVVVTNNSGPSHIAAAVATPVVTLYALTNPQHTPWMVSSRVLSHDVSCRWCFRSVCPEGHHHCLTLVSPQEVADAACALIGSTERSVPHASAASVGFTSSLA